MTNLLAQMSSKCLCQTNDSGRLPLSQRSGVDARDNHVVPVNLRGQAVTDPKRNLGLRGSVQVVLVLLDSGTLRNLGNMQRRYEVE
jgi:hypothetical protein